MIDPFLGRITFDYNDISKLNLDTSTLCILSSYNL